mgnify:CR=1 FL=1
MCAWLVRPSNHTPTSQPFLSPPPRLIPELIKLYKGLLASKRSNVQASIERLEGGLTKLRKTQARVDGTHLCCGLLGRGCMGRVLERLMRETLAMASNLERCPTRRPAAPLCAAG